MEFLVFIFGLILGAAFAAAWFGKAMNELSVREFKQLKKELDK